MILTRWPGSPRPALALIIGLFIAWPLAHAENRAALSVYGPMQFSGRSRRQILKYRQDIVGRHPELAKDYRPKDEIYSGIEDGKPWWGLMGQFYYGPGEKSIQGLSAEARYLLNPFLLVGFEAASFPKGRWDAAAVEADFSDPAKFDVYPHFRRLQWDRARGSARVAYDMSGYLKQLSKYVAPVGGSYEETQTISFEPGKQPQTIHLVARDQAGDRKLLSESQFFLKADNARDLGFDYLYVDLAASSNMRQQGHSRTATRILRYYHTGGSCGYPGGCNNGSPYQAEFDKLHIDALPALLVLRLWRRPPDGASRPDMTFNLTFE